MRKNFLLWIECAGIFILIPVLLWLRVVSTPLIMIPIIIICVPVIFWLGRKYGYTRAVFWQGDRDAERIQLVTIINRFLLISVVLFSIVFAAYPLHLFDLPRSNPIFWLMLLALYPFISAYPQELLYRSFFFRRYEGLFSNQQHLVVINAFLFGWMHIVLHNGMAVLFSIVAGFLFADTYRKTQSLRLTCLEHSLYGCLIFTLGYAEAFLYEPLFRALTQ